MRHTCSILAVPPSLNVYQDMYWAEQRRVKGEFELLTRAAVNSAKWPRGCQHIDLRAVLTFPTNRRRDPSNYGATLWKFVLDALVEAGVIPDDTQEYVRTHEPVIVTGESENTFIAMKGE